jgi:hypothetical protein
MDVDVDDLELREIDGTDPDAARIVRPRLCPGH